MTTTVVLDDLEIQVPDWVQDLESFRRWGRSEDFPEKGRVCYLGEIWIDTTMEQLFSHNQVKTEFTVVLGGIARRDNCGTYFCDGASLANVTADISTIPDGMFVTQESFEQDRLELREGAKSGYVELEGTPDMVLEIVSDSSARKDKTVLKAGYAKAGIAEYWLVDARKQPPEFLIFRLGAQGYKSVSRDRDGWVKSTVLGRSFRLVEGQNALGHPQYHLETAD